MANETKPAAVTSPVVQIPGVGAVPVVAIELPDGTIALRHPSELAKGTAPAAPKTGGQ